MKTITKTEMTDFGRTYLGDEDGVATTVNYRKDCDAPPQLTH